MHKWQRNSANESIESSRIKLMAHKHKHPVRGFLRENHISRPKRIVAHPSGLAPSDNLASGVPPCKHLGFGFGPNPWAMDAALMNSRPESAQAPEGESILH